MNPKDKQPQKLDASTTACTQLSDTALLEELRRRIERTNQTVGELTTLNDELRAVNKKLEESEALKSHFISNITNEIINPFTSILGLSRAILSVDKESWKKVVSMVALIHSEAFSLDFQFRNIFFAAKVEAGEEVPEVVSVDIQALVDGIIESFRYELRKRQVEVKVHNRLPKDDTKEGNFAFNTDPIYLKLVLANLLSNAMNFSKKESSVDVTLEMAGATHNGAGLRCRDSTRPALTDFRPLHQGQRYHQLRNSWARAWPIGKQGRHRPAGRTH